MCNHKYQIADGVKFCRICDYSKKIIIDKVDIIRNEIWNWVGVAIIVVLLTIAIIK